MYGRPTGRGGPAARCRGSGSAGSWRGFGATCPRGDSNNNTNNLDDGNRNGSIGNNSSIHRNNYNNDNSGFLAGTWRHLPARNINYIINGYQLYK